jgi:LDH2 family malate/lactate/ureidoglycolate dehydrogenase
MPAHDKETSLPAPERFRPMEEKPADAIEVSIDSLTALVVGLLTAAGVPARAARVVTDGLVSADIEDQASHGVTLLTMYLDRLAGGSVAPAGEGRVASDTGSAIVIDAENALGQVTSERAVTLAVERAHRHGLASVAVRNGFHFGTAGRWARKIAEHGCVGIVLSNTRPLLPAPGGAERVVGNNPVAIAVPADGGPIVADLALSAGAMGKIRLAEATAEKIPEGWATDADGVPTTDPGAAIRGMLLPAAGPKGFALAVMIDLLAGGLSSGAIGEEVRPLYGDPKLPYRCAHLFLAIDVAAFRPIEEFSAAATQFAQRIRSARRAPNVTDIRMPGDRARAARDRNKDNCRVARATIAALLERARAARVTPPSEFR